MSPITEAIDVFEGEAKRTFWLPAITLGYVATVSHSSIDFALAVAAIGGARFWIDFVESDLVDQDDQDDPLDDNILLILSSRLTGLSGYFTMAIGLIFPLAYLASPIRLWMVFTFYDPVIVGLSGAWAGIAVILLMNTGQYRGT